MSASWSYKAKDTGSQPLLLILSYYFLCSLAKWSLSYKKLFVVWNLTSLNTDYIS